VKSGGVKGWYVDLVDEVSTRSCLHCGQPLAYVDDVGWVAVVGDDYDMCARDPYGNHLPGPANRTDGSTDPGT